MTGFRRRRRGIELSLSATEASVLRDLVRQLYTLLEPPPVADPLEAMVGLRAEAPPRPDDPAVMRLLPDALQDDPDAAADFRRRTEDDLRAGKREAASRVLGMLPEAGGKAGVDEEAAQAWLGVLTDLRLVLATRLDLKTDEDALALDRIHAGDPKAPAVALYQFLTLLQEQLVQAVAGW